MRGALALLAAGCCGLAALAAGWAGGGPEGGPPAPELFAEGTISTPDDERGITFTPDGLTAYFTKTSPTTTSRPVSVICVSHLSRGRWGTPEVAPFSGLWHDSTPALSPDGSRLFFTSDRPGREEAETPEGAAETRQPHIWVLERTEAGWSDPHRLGAPIEASGEGESAPSPAADGTLYFSSSRPGGKGSEDLYRARWLGGRYAPPENLAALNSGYWESLPAIAPDQSVLVFTGAGRPDTPAGGGARYARPHLYVSFATAGGGWSEPRLLPPPVNSAAGDLAPSFTPDCKWLFFTSERGFVSVPMPHRVSARELQAGLAGTLNGRGNIYRVASGSLRALAAAPEEKGGSR